MQVISYFITAHAIFSNNNRWDETQRGKSALTQGIPQLQRGAARTPRPFTSQRHPQKAERLSDIALHSADWSHTHSLLSQIIITAAPVPAHTRMHTLFLSHCIKYWRFQLSTGSMFKHPPIKTQRHAHTHIYSVCIALAAIQTTSIRVSIVFRSFLSCRRRLSEYTEALHPQTWVCPRPSIHPHTFVLSFFLFVSLCSSIHIKVPCISA